MDDMKKFVTAAKKAEPGDQPQSQNKVTFEVDGRQITAREPSESLITQLQLSEASSSRSSDQKMATYLDFCLFLFAPDDRAWFSSRLFDMDDEFDHETLVDVAMWVIEYFTDNPTKPSSESTTSSENGGASSTEIASVEVSGTSTSPLPTPST